MNEQTPPALTAAERKALKARAHHLNPVVIVGEAGLSDAVLAEAERAIVIHELIKIRVLGDDRDARTELMGRFCDALGAAPVQMIGKLLVLWRPRPVTERDASGPHLPKKIAGSGARTKAAGSGARTTSGTGARSKSSGSAAAPGRSNAGKTAKPGSRSAIATPRRPADGEGRRTPAAAGRTAGGRGAGARDSGEETGRRRGPSGRASDGGVSDGRASGGRGASATGRGRAAARDDAPERESRPTTHVNRATKAPRAALKPGARKTGARTRTTRR